MLISGEAQNPGSLVLKGRTIFQLFSAKGISGVFKQFINVAKGSFLRLNYYGLSN